MSAKHRGAIDLSKANWKDVKESKYDVVILPWGAFEPHNYHLPYMTDCYLSQSVALDSAYQAYEKSNTLCAVMPPVFFGSQNPGQWSMPLCVHSNTETQKAILTDIVDSLKVQGLNKLVIINGHGGNSFKGFIRDMAMRNPEFMIIAIDWWTFIPGDKYFEAKPDEHAGELETSVLMHYHPDLVKLEQAGDGAVSPMPMESINNKTGWLPRNWQVVSKDTGIGDPRKATADKGARYAAAVTARIADLLTELKNQH